MGSDVGHTSVVNNTWWAAVDTGSKSAYADSGLSPFTTDSRTRPSTMNPGFRLDPQTHVSGWSPYTPK